MISSEPVIQVSNLEKIYRSGLIKKKKLHALQKVNLEVPRGKIYGLLGPNGAGKTTLIKVLLGIVRKSAGDANVLGMTAGDSRARRRIGYLPENHRIPAHLNGNTALEYYGCLSGMSVGEIRRRAPELLEKVGLRGREKDRVSGYSKGMQQRLGLAQSMLHSPELIILDEPTDGVDPVGRKEIREVLRGLADDGATIFLNSHLLQEIELTCESVAILTHGQVRKTGSVLELTQALEGAPVLFDLVGEESVITSSFPPSAELKISKGNKGITFAMAQLKEQAEVDAVVDLLRQSGISIVNMRRRELTLEEAFLEIVKEDA